MDSRSVSMSLKSFSASVNFRPPMLASLRFAQQAPPATKSRTDIRRHSRRRPKRPMQPHKVVMREVKRDRCPMVIDLLRKGVRQPRKPAHAHSHCEVLPLNDACRDMPAVWRADNRRPFRADNVRGAIPPSPGGFSVVKFNCLPVIDIGSERGFYRFDVRGKGIRGTRLPTRYVGTSLVCGSTATNVH